MQPLNVYSTDVKIWATVYVRANSPEKALLKVRNRLRGECLEIEPTDWKHDPDDQSEILISGRNYDDPLLPRISLAPTMTIDHEHIDNIKANELELCNESLGAEADAPSCQQVYRENGSPDQA